MAEVTAAEREAKAEAAFGTGFGDTPPAVIAPEKVVDAPVVDPAKPVAATPAPAPEKPRYVRLTEQDWNNTKAAAGKVATLESQIAKLTGSLPKAEQIVQQVLESVRSQTPAGGQIDPQVLVDAFAEQEKDFPELAGQNRKAIEHVLKHLGASSTTPAPSVDVDAAVQRILTAREQSDLEEAHPDWSQIVGRPPAEGAPIDQANPFRQWLAKQPAAYQKKIGETNSPAVVQSAITRFLGAGSNTATPATPTRAAARRAVIEDAITPRADGNPPPLNAPVSAEDAFAQGFKTGRPH